LLLFDEVQAGHFRTGKFHSWQRILEDGETDSLPDGISMAKGLAAGFRSVRFGCAKNLLMFFRRGRMRARLAERRWRARLHCEFSMWWSGMISRQTRDASVNCSSIACAACKANIRALCAKSGV